MITLRKPTTAANISDAQRETLEAIRAIRRDTAQNPCLEEIANYRGVKKPAVFALVRRLQRDGLVTQQEKRHRSLMLTRKGHGLLLAVSNRKAKK